MTTNNQAPSSGDTATASTILPSRLVHIPADQQPENDNIECSLHYLPKQLLREFNHVFNEEYLKFSSVSESSGTAMDVDMADGIGDNSNNGGLRLLAIPTNQRARADLVAVGDHIEQEKDRLLNVVSMCYFCIRSCICINQIYLTFRLILLHIHNAHTRYIYNISFYYLANTSVNNSVPRDIGQITLIHVQDCP